MSWNNYVVRPPTLVTDFSTTTGMTLTQGTGSVALDTTAAYVKTGTASLKIVQLASASSAFVDLDCRNAALGGTGSEGFSAAADNLWHLRSFVDTPANHQTTSLFCSNTAAGFAAYYAATVMAPQMSSSTGWTDRWWDRVENRKDWTVAAGSPSWSTPIRTIRIRPGANANGVLTTWLDALYRGGYARPKILITFDDSNDQQYVRAKPILDEFGLKGTFYCIGKSISENVAGSLTEAMADTLYADGHDLAFHQWQNGVYDNFSQITSTELQAEIDSWMAYTARKDWTRARFHMAYPQGERRESIRAVLASNGFLTGRSTLRLLQSHVLGLDDALGLKGWSWDAADGTAGPIAWMDNAVSYGSTVMITFHQHHATVSSGAQIADADFRTICRHAYRLQQANLADVVTVSQYYNGLTSPRKVRS